MKVTANGRDKVRRRNMKISGDITRKKMIHRSERPTKEQTRRD